MENLSVSVVVPTAGSRDWRAAVRSAYLQAEAEVEVLLVNNGLLQIPPDPEFPELRMLTSDPDLGANGARQLGVSQARYELVALLDDDDEWTSSKLIEQWRVVQSFIPSPMTSAWVCGAGQFIVQEGQETKLAPRSFFPVVIEDVASYLFLRKGLKASFNQLQSSTLLFPKFVAKSVPFDSELKLHQDWTWLLDVEERLCALILVCPKYLVRYHKGIGPGITRSTRSFQSVKWAEARLTSKTPRVRGDFFLTVPFNMALEVGAIDDATKILVQAMRTHRPGLPAVARAILAIARQVARGMQEGIRTRKRFVG